MDFVFLIYGFAFLSLGIIVIIRLEYVSEFGLSKILWLLAVFAFLHGVQEWLALEFIRRINPAVSVIEPWFLLISYIFLFEFGRRLVGISIPLNESILTKILKIISSPWIYLLPGLGVFVSFLFGQSLSVFSIFSRYMFGFTGSLITGIGFRYYWIRHLDLSHISREHDWIIRSFQFAGFSIIFYGFLAGIVVPEADFFPADTINQENFKEIFFIPVQVLRALCAVSIAFSVGFMLRIFHYEDMYNLKSIINETVQVSRYKSDFLSRMSHELRTPLNGILGFAQLLKVTVTKDINKIYVNEILKASRLLVELINDVLDLSRIESGKLQLHMEKINLQKIVQESLEIISPMLLKTNLEIVNEIEKEKKYLIHADKRRMKQILLNLLSNAIKYNQPHGKIFLQIELISEDRIRIHVKDTGVGISEKRKEDIFQPFERMDAEATSIEGSGVGLAVTKELAELMECRIGFKSDLHKGSDFWIEMKLG
ncbi:MAG: ATP-binding protein [Spirochaetia bacterium]|nr:ATP-binding protein [Spirochaetia bacterium]